MRVLLIHQTFVSPEEPGGTRHFEFASRCVAEGHTFTIVASNLSYQTGERAVASRNLVTEQMIGGVRVLRAYTYPSLHRSFFWRVIAFLSFMPTSIWAALRSGPADIVMGTSPPIFQALSAWLVAALRRRPFLLEIRDLWPEFAIDIGVLTNPILIALARWLEHFLYARATHILVNSPAYRDYLLGKGVPSAKISLIANGVDPGMFDPAASGESIRKEYGLDGKFIAMYAGAFGLANDLPTVLKAAHRLQDQPHIQFLLVGDGKERHNLEAQARALNLTNVTFTGSRPKTDMIHVLAAADVCIATLKNIRMFRMPYPNKVFDYMAAGRPTVLGIDGVIREVVEMAKGGIFVPPGDDAALAEAISDLSQDAIKAKTMGNAARAYVVRNFNRLHQAEQFVTLVQQLAERRAPHHVNSPV